MKLLPAPDLYLPESKPRAADDENRAKETGFEQRIILAPVFPGGKGQASCGAGLVGQEPFRPMVQHRSPGVGSKIARC